MGKQFDLNHARARRRKRARHIRGSAFAASSETPASRPPFATRASRASRDRPSAMSIAGFDLSSIARALPLDAAKRASASVNLLLAVADMKRDKRDQFERNLDSAVRVYGDASVVSLKFNTLNGRGLTMLTEAVKTGKRAFAETLLTRYRADPSVEADGACALAMALAARDAFLMFGEALEAYATNVGFESLEAYVREKYPAGAEALAKRRAETRTRGRSLSEVNEDATSLKTVSRAERALSTTSSSVETVRYHAMGSGEATTELAMPANAGEESEGESEHSMPTPDSTAVAVEYLRQQIRILRELDDRITEIEFADADVDVDELDRFRDALSAAEIELVEVMDDIYIDHDEALPAIVVEYKRRAGESMTRLNDRVSTLLFRNRPARADAPPSFFSPRQ